jgi:hypothetical protein
MKNKIIDGAILVLIVFLVGFAPEFLKLSNAKSETAGLKQQLSEEKRARTIADFRNATALLYTEASKNNFSIAGDQATSSFTDLRQFADQAPLPLRQRLNSVLARQPRYRCPGPRQGRPASAAVIQSMFLQMRGF